MSYSILYLRIKAFISSLQNRYKTLDGARRALSDGINMLMLTVFNIVLVKNLLIRSRHKAQPRRTECHPLCRFS